MVEHQMIQDLAVGVGVQVVVQVG
jgi:hypothetical protein